MNDLLQSHKPCGDEGIGFPIYNIFKPKRPNLTNLRLINTSSRVKHIHLFVYTILSSIVLCTDLLVR
jgi:hypothetical protein